EFKGSYAPRITRRRQPGRYLPDQDRIRGKRVGCAAGNGDQLQGGEAAGRLIAGAARGAAAAAGSAGFEFGRRLWPRVASQAQAKAGAKPHSRGGGDHLQLPGGPGAFGRPGSRPLHRQAEQLRRVRANPAGAKALAGVLAGGRLGRAVYELEPSLASVEAVCPASWLRWRMPCTACSSHSGRKIHRSYSVFKGCGSMAMTAAHRRSRAASKWAVPATRPASRMGSECTSISRGRAAMAITNVKRVASRAAARGASHQGPGSNGKATAEWPSQASTPCSRAS